MQKCKLSKASKHLSIVYVCHISYHISFVCFLSPQRESKGEVLRKTQLNPYPGSSMKDLNNSPA